MYQIVLQEVNEVFSFLYSYAARDSPKYEPYRR